mgnify:CR=1 FL=1
MSHLKHHQQTILVTGSADRIGKHIATYFANQGASVVIHYNRSKEKAEALSQSLNNGGCHSAIVGADLTDNNATDCLIERAVKAIGKPLTTLINNASSFIYDDMTSTTAESWDQNIKSNLQAPFQLTQQFAKQCPINEAGNIINMIDQRVWNLNPEFSSYTLAKSALWTLTQTSAQALAPHIRVNAIGPGPVLKSIHQSEDEFHEEQEKVPLGHGTTPEEIAKTIDFFLSSPSITGQMLALDGGQHLAWQTPDFQSFR